MRQNKGLKQNKRELRRVFPCTQSFVTHSHGTSLCIGTEAEAKRCLFCSYCLYIYSYQGSVEYLNVSKMSQTGFFFTTLPFQGGAFTSIFFFIFHFRHLLVAVVRVAVHKFVAAPRMHKLRPGFLLLQFRLSAFQTSLSFETRSFFCRKQASAYFDISIARSRVSKIAKKRLVRKKIALTKKLEWPSFFLQLGKSKFHGRAREEMKWYEKYCSLTLTISKCFINLMHTPRKRKWVSFLRECLFLWQADLL